MYSVCLLKQYLYGYFYPVIHFSHMPIQNATRFMTCANFKHQKESIENAWILTIHVCITKILHNTSLMTSNLIGFVCIHHVMIQLLDHSYHNAFLFIRYLQYILLTRFISKFCCIVSLKKIIPFIVRLSKYLSHA